MTAAMQALFDHAVDSYIRSFLSPVQERSCLHSLNALEDALLGTMTDAQKALWDQWRGAETDYDPLYEHALFQAAFALAKEL